MEHTNPTDIPGIAVVGSGYWGKNLVRNYHNLGALKVICDKNEMVLAQFKEQYPDVEMCLAFSELLSRKDIQGIVIATPAETHYTLAREALLSGKHVYVEKPLVLHEEEGRELIKTAETNNRVLMVGHLLQYHPVFVELKALADSGDLGRINYIYSNRLNLGKIRREENILWSFAPHDISMILSLAGEAPDSVFATGGNYLHKRIADVTTTHLEFPSGLKAHIFVSWLHPFKEQKLVVVGDKKMAVFDDTQPWEDKLLIYPHQINWQNNIPVPEKADPERVDIPRDEPLKLECKHFLDCMAKGKHPLTDGREGLDVLNVLNAAQGSLDRPAKASAFSSQTQDLQTQTPQKAVSPPSSGEGGLYPDAFIHETAIVDK
ncbi:MAG: Gfo/Idh/MocA family oxidoreductase, partial [Deltaproteobacteria bacterium]|nr:Gfo/Idh/MocA family oxidoreductase [Deltaproteobacteria bacterium]